MNEPECHAFQAPQTWRDAKAEKDDKLTEPIRDGIKKTPMGAVNLFGKLLTFGHLNNWSQGWARRLLRTTCGH
ncbi:hypothetical protein [Burkholderia vietnamiensis]|uniref:hypothetical protein n=1 Tax=Burkholderia vietnamiensis TaxID=60552 RepID=UPI001592A52D|nr:hypothetical protein [Burkholderia vietnamiensis]